jgi:hypothetical protein
MLLSLLVLLLVLLALATIWVEREARDERWVLDDRGSGRALVLFHPSRDARFSDQLAIAASKGLNEAGLGVDRRTTTRHLPARPEGYLVVVIISNTYFGRPDLPTLRYLRRARLDGLPAVGFMAGAGSTERAESRLKRELQSTGAASASIHSFWLLRPNDEWPASGSNRLAALERAEFLGGYIAKLVVRDAPASARSKPAFDHLSEVAE